MRGHLARAERSGEKAAGETPALPGWVLAPTLGRRRDNDAGRRAGNDAGRVCRKGRWVRGHLARALACVEQAAGETPAVPG
ncbi:MAG: hypothetical protein HYV07_08060 [Deltaproteobacteria bacterium]|nr:hypothetical protein [Deltaproteobacteria bacterium]